MLKAVEHYNSVAGTLYEALGMMGETISWANDAVDFQSKKAKAQRAAFKKIRTMILAGKNAERMLNELKTTYDKLKEGQIQVTVEMHRCSSCQQIFIIGDCCEKCSKKKLDETLT